MTFPLRLSRLFLNEPGNDGLRFDGGDCRSTHADLSGGCAPRNPGTGDRLRDAVEPAVVFSIRYRIFRQGHHPGPGRSNADAQQIAGSWLISSRAQHTSRSRRPVPQTLRRRWHRSQRKMPSPGRWGHQQQDARQRQFCRSTCTPAASGFAAVLLCGSSARLRICRMICDRICPVIPGCHGRQASSFLLVELNSLFDDLTKLGEYSFSVITMTTAEEQARSTADKAVVFVRPFNNFHVPERLIHDSDCSTHHSSESRSFTTHSVGRTKRSAVPAIARQPAGTALRLVGPTPVSSIVRLAFYGYRAHVSVLVSDSHPLIARYPQCLQLSCPSCLLALRFSR